MDGIFAAIRNNNPEKLKQLLQDPNVFDATAEDDDGMRPLSLAVSKCAECAEDLLDRDDVITEINWFADPLNSRTDTQTVGEWGLDGRWATALQIAVVGQYLVSSSKMQIPTIVEKLLDKGADPNINGVFSLYNVREDNVLHTAILRTIRSGREDYRRDNFTSVKMLLENGANPNNTASDPRLKIPPVEEPPPDSMITPLQLITRYSPTPWLVKCVEVLLQAGADPDSILEDLKSSQEDILKKKKAHEPDSEQFEILQETGISLQHWETIIKNITHQLHLNQSPPEQNISKILQLAKNEIIPPEVLEIIAEKVYNQKYDHVKQRRLWCKENNIQL
jgi:hypothetical protein